MSVGVTHQQFDLDGGSSLRVLERQGIISHCCFGQEDLADWLRKEKPAEVILTDFKWLQTLDPDIKMTVYDHHQVEGKERSTAFDVVLEEPIHRQGLDPERLKFWQKIVWLGDYKAETDNMGIDKALKRLHLFRDDQFVYQRWFVPLFDSFFANEAKVEQGVKIFREVLLQFSLSHPESPAKTILAKWAERLNDPEKILSGSPRNLFHFLVYLEEKTARDWLELTLEGLHQEQTLFQQDKGSFRKAKIEFFGNTLVIYSLTSSQTFARAARHLVYSVDPEDAIPLIKEKIKTRNDPWILIQVCPQTKNFQIFANGHMKTVQAIIEEIVKGLRAEMLKKKGLPVPSWNNLSAGGNLEGTEPLYFHKMETGYSSILWGSLKRPAPPAAIFGEMASDICQSLVEVIKQAADRNYFPADCLPGQCRHCRLYPWQLKKCNYKRKQARS